MVQPDAQAAVGGVADCHCQQNEPDLVGNRPPGAGAVGSDETATYILRAADPPSIGLGNTCVAGAAGASGNSAAAGCSGVGCVFVGATALAACCGGVAPAAGISGCRGDGAACL